LKNPVRNCLYEPIPELFQAAALLHKAAIAHASGDTVSARILIAQTDANPHNVHSPIFDWSETLFGGRLLSLRKPICPALRESILGRVNDPKRPAEAPKNSNYIPAKLAAKVIARDGYFCRYCGIPVIDPKAQSFLRKHKAYRSVLRWWSTEGEINHSPKNFDKHVAFQAMDLDLDHIVPRSLGGMNALRNLIVACAPCNNGKSYYTLTEMRLNNPRYRSTVVPVEFEDWKGLTQVLR
jgi:5-methylcytosine-specific restriction endonuclease McrA